MKFQLLIYFNIYVKFDFQVRSKYFRQNYMYVPWTLEKICNLQVHSILSRNIQVYFIIFGKTDEFFDRTMSLDLETFQIFAVNVHFLRRCFQWLGIHVSQTSLGLCNSTSIYVKLRSYILFCFTNIFFNLILTARFVHDFIYMLNVQ